MSAEPHDMSLVVRSHDALAADVAREAQMVEETALVVVTATSGMMAANNVLAFNPGENAPPETVKHWVDIRKECGTMITANTAAVTWLMELMQNVEGASKNVEELNSLISKMQRANYSEFPAVAATFNDRVETLEGQFKKLGGLCTKSDLTVEHSGLRDLLEDEKVVERLLGPGFKNVKVHFKNLEELQEKIDAIRADMLKSYEEYYENYVCKLYGEERKLSEQEALLLQLRLHERQLQDQLDDNAAYKKQVNAQSEQELRQLQDEFSARRAQVSQELSRKRQEHSNQLSQLNASLAKLENNHQQNLLSMKRQLEEIK